MTSTVTKYSIVTEVGLRIQNGRLKGGYRCSDPECLLRKDESSGEGEKFKLGDRIVTRMRGSKTQRYHVQCYEKKFV